MYWIWKIYLTKQFREIIYTKFIGIWKIFITKQFREIIYTKFREILHNLAKFREIKYNEISRNFAKLKSLSSLFRISRNKKNPISRPPYRWH
jgi:hypothetical protein